MQCLYQQFRDYYEEKLADVENQWKSANISVEELQKMKIDLLTSYVTDLADQNVVLIQTAEELQYATETRVAVLEKLLQKATVVSKVYMQKISDYQQEFRKTNAKKVKTSALLQLLQHKCQLLEEERNTLRDQTSYLGQDLTSLIQLITHARNTGFWERTSNSELGEAHHSPTEKLSTSDVHLQRYSSVEELNGKAQSVFSEDFGRSLTQFYYSKKTSPSVSISCYSHDGPASYAGRPTEKDVVIKRLQVDLKYAQRAHDDGCLQLLEKDHTIAALQCQITEIRHELALNEHKCNGHLQNLRLKEDLQRLASFEHSRYEETVNRLRSQLEELRGDKTSVYSNVVCGPSDTRHQVSQLTQNNTTMDGSNDDGLDLKNACALDNVECTDHETRQGSNAAKTTSSNAHLGVLCKSDHVPETREAASEINVVKDEVGDKLQAGADALRRQVAQSDRDASELRDRLATRDTTISQLKDKLQTVERDLQQRESELLNNKLDNETLRRIQEELQTVESERITYKLEVSKLKDELRFMDSAAHETRIVLAKEIAERHDTIKTLRHELSEQAEHHKEIVQQLVLKTEVIKELRKEVKLAQSKADEPEGNRYQTELEALRHKLDKQNVEIENQKITICNLQDALVQSKRGGGGVDGGAGGTAVVLPNPGIANGTSANSSIQPKVPRPSSREVFDI